jgi:hypothetical protein
MVSSEKKKEKKPKAQLPESATQARELTVDNMSRRKADHGQKTGKHDNTKPLHRYQTQRSLNGSPPLYIMLVGALVLLAGSFVLYISSSAKKPWSPVPEGGESFEPTPVPVVQAMPVRVEKPAPTPVAPPPKDIVQQSRRPNAVVNVPNVGLRNTPNIGGKATLGGLRRGERVEIVGRMSGKGPAWVKIRTRSGRVGWVFASVVKERKGA